MKDGDLRHLAATTRLEPRNGPGTKLIGGKNHATSTGQNQNSTLIGWPKVIDLQPPLVHRAPPSARRKQLQYAKGQKSGYDPVTKRDSQTHPTAKELLQMLKDFLEPQTNPMTILRRSPYD